MEVMLYGSRVQTVSSLKHNQSVQTGIIPWAAKRFSTQKTSSFAVTFFSSTRNGSTLLAVDPYDDIENPFGPVGIEICYYYVLFLNLLIKEGRTHQLCYRLGIVPRTYKGCPS